MFLIPQQSQRMAPKRPTERQCMRDWLIDKLESGEFRGLRWRDRKEKIFSIKWFHGSRHGYSEKESAVFEAWAVHTGRRDNSDARRWKANFRCAIKSLKAIQELDSSITKGQNAVRIFRFLDTPAPRRRANNQNSRSTDSGHSSGPLDKSPTNSHADSGIFDESDETNDASTSCADGDIVTNETNAAVTEPFVTGNNGWPTDPVTIATHASPSPVAHTSYNAVSTNAAFTSASICNDKYNAEYHTAGHDVGDFDVTGSYVSTALPMFEEICPGITKIDVSERRSKAVTSFPIYEYGKDHIIRRHLCGFKVELGCAAPLATTAIPVSSSHSQPDVSSSMETVGGYDKSSDDDESQSSQAPEADIDLTYVANEIIIYHS
ncbi:interferon regulatory factor 2-like isoform X2 [Dreissena polymorpha]|uniref:interferon regulatory factor 2-like isoform X2 n=1 Tax=Dreissena polymorpha TaxID=45954 RepID=UPI00226463D0|nr:interferon regulatory factor 2-like isoform X2 [Dreissena polymorpha]